MRVLLKLEFDCSPDTTWSAITSPTVFRQVSSPLMGFESLDEGGFPEEWTEGVHKLRAKAFGVVPIGDQTVDLAFGIRKGARTVRDTGRGLSGPLAFVNRWEHTMAVSPLPGNRTLYRDQLIFSAEPVTALLWPAYWAFWQKRGLTLRALSRDWDR